MPRMPFQFKPCFVLCVSGCRKKVFCQRGRGLIELFCVLALAGVLSLTALVMLGKQTLSTHRAVCLARVEGLDVVFHVLDLADGGNDAALVALSAVGGDYLDAEPVGRCGLV